MSDDNPPVYDQTFFLDLARPSADTDEAREEARERWNAWRRDPANADVAVTFEGVDFRTEENAGISFDGFLFGDRARFEGATFGNWARFEGATFGARASFDGATFGNWASFEDAAFGDWVRFIGATFGDWASFERATFGDWARFICTTFGREAMFEGATFGHRAWFGGVTLGFGARFVDVMFGDWAWFNGTIFGRNALFEGAAFGDGARFVGATFGAQASFAGRAGDGDVEAPRKRWVTVEETERSAEEAADRRRWESDGFVPGRFSEISFASAHFLGSVSFARRSFERSADFTGVRFDVPPDFDEATNLQRIDFTGARAGFAPAGRPWWKRTWTTDSIIAVHLRTLRSQIEATKNHDFERDLYIEERKAERGIYFARYRREKRWGALAGHCLWIGVMGAYWALSDYGRSWLRPATWLLASIPAFHFLYAGLLADRREGAVVAAREAVTRASEGKDALTVVKGWKAAEASVLADYDATVGQLAVSDAVPFVGPLTIDGDAKKFLYCGVWPAGKGEAGVGTLVEPCRPIPPPGFQIAMISQNLLSLLLVFFIGLALRNYFRLK